MKLSGWCLGLMLVLSLVAGCGEEEYKAPDGVILKGRIVKSGRPLKLNRPDIGLGMVELMLLPSDAGESESGSVDANGMFEFRGPGNGVPAGRYKLAIYHWQEGPGTTDELGGQFGESVTPVEIEVPADKVGDTHNLGTIELNRFKTKSAKTTKTAAD